jgi:hypothetical protein
VRIVGNVGNCRKLSEIVRNGEMYGKFLKISEIVENVDPVLVVITSTYISNNIRNILTEQ